MTSDLRREAEALADSLLGPDFVGTPGEVTAMYASQLNAFAKAQRVQEVEAMYQCVLSRKDFGISGYDYRRNVLDWLAQRKKELE